MAELRTISDALGGSRELALFEAFALRSETALSIAEACEFAGVAWATAHRLVERWRAKDILRATEKRGKAWLFRINTESPTIALLVRAAQLAIRERFESDLLEEGFPELAFASLGAEPVFGPPTREVEVMARPITAVSTQGGAIPLFTTSSYGGRLAGTPSQRLSVEVPA